MKIKRALTAWSHLHRAEDHQEHHRHQASHSSRCFFTITEIICRSSVEFEDLRADVSRIMSEHLLIYIVRDIFMQDIHANPFLSINIVFSSFFSCPCKEVEGTFLSDSLKTCFRKTTHGFLFFRPVKLSIKLTKSEDLIMKSELCCDQISGA